MILELDCGNTLIKWRLLPVDGAEPWDSGCVETTSELLDRLDACAGAGLDWCRIASVRSEDETLQLLDDISRGRQLRIRRAVAAGQCAGVRNGYLEPTRLGVDRWLAMLGAYHLAGKACLVIDLGTAVTADFIQADGRHLGGYICPGLPLMRAQLRTHTRRIRYDDDEARQAVETLLPGGSTAEAVERGCRLMLRGFVREQCLAAAELLGNDFDVFLTGGDASLVEGVWPSVRSRADLVFVGLGLACPIVE
ncbi:type III pantothenate kinase [Pseudomonas stutzeri]|nr:type III pantothenate kinase [Stutzerimonas stutzeri]